MNLFRGLIWNDEISLTLADLTEVVNVGIRLHKPSARSGYLLGKALSALAFFSACLKGEKGEISISLQRGAKELIGASGNRALALRGYIAEKELEGEAEGSEEEYFDEDCSFTVVRDDGYARPFVGSCAFPKTGKMDEAVEEYYRVSEQLPTKIKTVLIANEGGMYEFIGLIALQPLPFASAESLKKVEETELAALLRKMRSIGVEAMAKGLLGERMEARKAEYKCNCSRERLSALLVTLGEGQIREIVVAEGAVRVHCHYCNTDYEFTGEDVDVLFSKAYEGKKDEEN